MVTKRVSFCLIKFKIFRLTLVLSFRVVTSFGVASFEVVSDVLVTDVFLRLPARLRLTRLFGVLAPELETELEVDDRGRSNRLIRSFWVAETRLTTGRAPIVESGILVSTQCLTLLFTVKHLTLFNSHFCDKSTHFQRYITYLPKDVANNFRAF